MTTVKTRKAFLLCRGSSGYKCSYYYGKVATQACPVEKLPKVCPFCEAELG